MNEAIWWPIPEYQPKRNLVVLLSDGKSVHEGYLTAGGIYVQAGSNAQLPFVPTHYTSLPDPPKHGIKT